MAIGLNPLFKASPASQGSKAKDSVCFQPVEGTASRPSTPGCPGVACLPAALETLLAAPRARRGRGCPRVPRSCSPFPQQASELCPLNPLSRRMTIRAGSKKQPWQPVSCDWAEVVFPCQVCIAKRRWFAKKKSTHVPVNVARSNQALQNGSIVPFK